MPGFLISLLSMVSVRMHVFCVSAPEDINIITSGMTWCDIKPCVVG